MHRQKEDIEMEQLNSSRYSSTSSSQSGGGNMVYLVAGGLIGAAAALLLAPKSGSELRSDLADATRRGYDGALDLSSSVKEQAGSLYQTVREKGTGAALSEAVSAGNELLSGSTSSSQPGSDLLSLNEENTSASSLSPSEH